MTSWLWFIEKSSNQSAAEEKAQKYYLSCMDKDEIQEKLGSQPLINILSKIGGWSITPSSFDENNWKFQDQVNLLHNEYNMGGLFSWAVGEDDRNSTRHVIQVMQWDVQNS